MKLNLTSLGLLYIAGVDGKVVKDAPTFRSLEEVYGSHDLKKRVLDRAALRASRIARSGMATNEKWTSVRTPDHCEFPIALHLLIDTSASMAGETEQAVLDSLPVINEFLESHPKSTKSISFFRDKPIAGLGDSADYCLKTAAVDEIESEAILAAYESELSQGGGDWLNNHFGALVQIMKSPVTVPWLNDPLKTHLVLLVTNTAPHFAGDGGEKHYASLTNFTRYYEDGMDVACEKNYYPSPKDIKKAFRDGNTYLGTVVLDSDSKEKWSYKAFDWLNTYLQQPNDLLAEQSSTGSIKKQLMRILTGLERAECGDIVTRRREEAAKRKKVSTKGRRALSKVEGQGESALTSTKPETEDDCPEPSPEVCRACIVDAGCCKQNRSKAPKLLIALQHRPEELFLEATTRLRAADADDDFMVHEPLVIELDTSSAGVEIEH